ncbi:MAG: hypothetical protein U1E65_35545 [Myxococcota bacterium]
MQIRYRRSEALTIKEREEIWGFFSKYVRRNRDTFEAKLDSGGEVFLGRDARGTLVAFGAVEVLEGNADGPYAALVSHWAAFDPKHRGGTELHQIGLRALLRYKLRHPTVPVYWLFSASTYKSYLLLARNTLTYWPRPSAPWPGRERAIVADAMRRLGEDNFDPELGVIRRYGASRYLEGVVADDPAALRDHDVRFYSALNPGQTDGDTLVCLCPMSLENWVHIARSALRRLRRPRRVAKPTPRTSVTPVRRSA